MSHIRILVCRVDNAADADRVTELTAIDLPQPDAAGVAAEASLDRLEAATLGHAALRAALLAQWEVVEAVLVAAYLRRVPTGQVRRYGCNPITVASRLGTLRLPRQVLVHRDVGVHAMPGDAALPAHAGRITAHALRSGPACPRRTSPSPPSLSSWPGRRARGGPARPPRWAPWSGGMARSACHTGAPAGPRR